MQTTIYNGLTSDHNHLKLIAVSEEVELSKGVSKIVATYLVVELEYCNTEEHPFTKKVKQLHQYDTIVKAQRKFERLNTM